MHTWYMFLKTGYFLYSIYQNQGFHSHPHVWVAAWQAIFLSFSWAFFYSLSSKPYTFLYISSFVVKKPKFYINFPMANKNVGFWFKKKKFSLNNMDLQDKKHHFKCRTVEPSPEWYIYETLPHLRLGEHWGRGNKKMVRARLGSCYETVSPSSIRRYTQKVSSICLPKIWAEQEHHQWICQSRQFYTWTLHEQLWATEECWEQGKVFPGEEHPNSSSSECQMVCPEKYT